MKDWEKALSELLKENGNNLLTVNKFIELKMFIKNIISQQRKEVLEEQRENAKEALKWIRKLVKDKKALEEINIFIKPLTK